MHIFDNVDLGNYSTMRLGGKARHMVRISKRDEIPEALAWAKQHKLPAIMIGSGSNIIWSDAGYKGLVIVNEIMGFQLNQEDEENAYLNIGAGENWDSVVQQAVKDGWHGIECLSFIPGTAGATPIQNVGAYGQEISDTLVSVEAYDNQTGSFITIAGPDCGFGYRSSRFKTTDHGRFFITSITLHLVKTKPLPPFFSSLQAYLDEHKITDYTPQIIRDAVIAIRKFKLPDPAKIANNGSFFQNPIIDKHNLTNLLAKYPNLVYWETGGGKFKLSGAWLVEQSGFKKGQRDKETGMAIWDKQPLVLINEHAKNTKQLIQFRDQIISAVQKKFGVKLQQEPELLGS